MNGALAVILSAAQVDLPSIKTVDNAIQTVILAGTVFAAIILAVAFGFQRIFRVLQEVGLFKIRRQDSINAAPDQPLKRLGDLSVESFESKLRQSFESNVFESKLRHSIRGEMQVFVTSFGKLEQSLNELRECNSEQLGLINLNLTKLIAIEETKMRMEGRMEGMRQA